MNSFLLPLQSQFGIDPNQQSPVATTIMLILLGGLVVAAIVGTILNNRGGTGKGGKFSKWEFKRQARALGLERSQTRTLLQLIKRLNFSDPQHLFRSSRRMNSLIRGGMQAIDASSASENQKEQEKATLFEIRRRVFAAAQTAPQIQSTKRLPQGQHMIITNDGKQFYDTEITSRLDDALGIECPADRKGQEIRWQKNTKIGVKVVAGENRIYTFVSRVLGYSNAGGISSMLIQHSDKIRHSQKRSSPRKVFEKAAYFYPVQVVTEGKGRKAKKRAAVLNSRRMIARIKDISSGGCRLACQRPLETGALVKIEFDTEAGRIAVFGKVRRVSHTPPRGAEMNIMFTKISQKHLNIIQSYIYDIEEV